MRFLFAGIVTSGLLLAGCAKEGLDGEATLVIKPQHHNSPIASTASYADSVYIRFNVQEVPQDPTRNYDAVFVGTVGDAHVRVPNLKWGDYSIYCTGWDTTQNERVVGGIVVTIKRKDRKEEREVIVPVAED